MARRMRYSRWDGTQVGFDLEADDVLAQLSDELMYDGNVNRALQRLMQRGFQDRDGRQIEGLRDMLKKLREKRQDILENHDLGGVYDEIARELDDLVDQERQAIDDMLEQARQSGDQRRQETAESSAMDKNMRLDFLPPDLAGKVRELQQHEFQSAEAQQRFDELMDRLREQLMQRYLDQMGENINNMTPQDMARMKDMFSELNNLLDKKNRGEDTEQDFQEFMEKFGDFFPGNPETLDELLEQMAQQMAAAQQMLNSMTPEQRAQLQQLSDQLLEDMDLRWQMEQLSQNLQQAFPQMGWDQGRQFSGDQPVGMGEAMDLMQQLGDMDALENLMRNASSPAALADVDFDAAKALLGPDAAKSLEKLAEMAKMLQDSGLVDNKDGRLELTPKGMRRLGANALGEVFAKLAKDKAGQHQLARTGAGQERTYDTKPYEYGDPFNLSIEKTIRNAITRTGGGTPVRLAVEDFEIEQTEVTVRSATVLMLDLSYSMILRDNFLPAKKVAMALYSLITSQFPRDYLGLVGFGELAREFDPTDLPEMGVDYIPGTNMQHALMLARRMLAGQSGTKQVIMITDGEPTAHIYEPTGEPWFQYPTTPECVHATLTEVARCTRDRITINSFVLDATPSLQRFIEHVSEINHGRAFFTTPDTLGDYVLVDFIEHKKRLRQQAGRR